MLALGLLIMPPVLRMAEDEMARDAAGGGVGVSPVVLTSGDFDRLMPLPLPLALAVRKGEAVRATLAGVPVREGGLLGLLIAGLSQDEKKSSPPSPAGVLVPVPSKSPSTSSSVTSLGYLLQ